VSLPGGVRPRLLQVFSGLTHAQAALAQRLARFSANESTSAYRLCRDVSRRLKRPVVSLHNATLGGHSAWGIPDFQAQKAKCLSGLGRLEGESAVDAKHALEAREAMLIRPRLLGLLSALRQCCQIEGYLQPYRDALVQAQPLLGKKIDLPGLSFPFRPRGEVESCIAQTLALARREREYFPEQMRILAAIWQAGEPLIKQGKLDSLVIPVADKFVASSSRGRDVAYLAAYVQALTQAVPHAVFLLFDTSASLTTPSLRYAPRNLCELGVETRGLGVFSPDGQTGQGLVDVLSALEGARLVILEPKPHTGFSGPERFRRADPTLATPGGYDPAWKEGQDWLGSGTALEALGNWWPPRPMGMRRGTVLTTHGPMPGGVWFRLNVSGDAGPGKGGEAKLWRRWVRLARLD